MIVVNAFTPAPRPSTTEIVFPTSDAVNPAVADVTIGDPFAITKSDNILASEAVTTPCRMFTSSMPIFLFAIVFSDVVNVCDTYPTLESNVLIPAASTPTGFATTPLGLASTVPAAIGTALPAGPAGPTVPPNSTVISPSTKLIVLRSCL